MTILKNDELHIHCVPRIQTRICVSSELGSRATSVWEQWMEPGGHIPVHYHDSEEVLYILSGTVELDFAGTKSIVSSQSTVIVPPGTLHGIRPNGASQVNLLAIFPVVDPRIYAPDGQLRPMPWEDRNT